MSTPSFDEAFSAHIERLEKAMTTANAGEPSELRTAALALLDKLEALWPRDERKHFGPHWQEEADALRAAITPAPAQPALNLRENCSPTLTQCPRCNNPHGAPCDQGKAQPEPQPAGGEPVAWVVRELCSSSPMQAFECSAVDAQATAMRWAEDGYEAEIVELVERAPSSLTDAQCDAIRAEERERCAKALNIGRGDALLACGEMSAQEWRTASAILVWLQGRIRAAAAGAERSAQATGKTNPG